MLLSIAIVSLFILLAGFWPFGPYQLTLMAARKLHRFPPLTTGATENIKAPKETFAICLCVYNERAVIREKVQDLLRLRAAAGGELEILIYVDCSDDGTTEILQAYGDQIDLVISPARQGKTFGMNLLVRRTSASIVMFTDANVVINSDAITVLRRYFANRSIGCVCSHLTYINPNDSATAKIGAGYWRINEWSKSLETDTGSVVGADGSLFAIRRSLHSPVPKGLFDDIYVSLSVLLQGRRVVRAPDLKAFETHTTNAEDEFSRKVRIACECMHVHFTLWPQLRLLDPWNVYKYVGHRLLRWIGGYLLLLGALLAATVIWAAVGPFWALSLPLAMSLAVCISMLARFGPGLILWNIVLAFAGTAIGVWRALRGQRAVTWDTPASARKGTLMTTGERKGS